jgi:putative transposase
MEITQYKKEYRSYDHLVFSCQYHVIFTPKYRRKVLINGIDTRLKKVIMEKEEDYGYKVIEMEVMPDHVHLLIDIKPRIDVIRCVNLIKGHTSHILRNEYPELRRKIPTLWTRSKFIASVGAVTLEAVEKYIEDQKKV